MKRFDDEIERVLNKAGVAAFGLTALAVLTLIGGTITGIAIGGYTEPVIGIWFVLGAIATAGLLYGLAVIVNLLGMHLMETWRQGRLVGDAAVER